MAQRETIEIWGLNEIEEVLNKLPKSLQHKFVLDTYSEILKNGVIKEAKRLVPVGDNDVISRQYASRTHRKGNLKRSLGVIRGKNRKYPTAFGGVRSKSVFRNGGMVNDGWYAHMVEFGHKARDGSEVLPRPFMRPAWDMWKNKSEQMIGVAFGKQITRYAKRILKRQTKTVL